MTVFASPFSPDDDLDKIMGLKLTSKYTEEKEVEDTPDTVVKPMETGEVEPSKTMESVKPKPPLKTKPALKSKPSLPKRPEQTNKPTQKDNEDEATSVIQEYVNKDKPVNQDKPVISARKPKPAVQQKPTLKPKPTSATSVGAKSNSATGSEVKTVNNTDTEPDLSQSDIMKYIEANTAADDDLDLFS